LKPKKSEKTLNEMDGRFTEADSEEVEVKEKSILMKAKVLSGL
jgi:hypothetical protein